MYSSEEIRRKYLDFFKSKNHVIISGASMIPDGDPSTLFVGSGIQVLMPYLFGEKHPNGTRLTNSQKSFRTEDMDDVGDNRHITFFEMLGNWSLGDYFKKEQLNWFFEFLVKELSVDPRRLYVSIYRGNSQIGIAKDAESADIWRELFKREGIQAKVKEFSEKKGIKKGERIFYYGDRENWWSRFGEPSNMPIGEPGGPDSEVFYDLGASLKRHENSFWKNLPCHINCSCGRFLEIGNNVFMEYVKTKDGVTKLPQKNVDFGGGLERITMIVQKKDTVFETDLFIDILNKIEKLSNGKNYKTNTKQFEIIADHIRAAVFILAEGIGPSNLEQGYVLRRLIRRAIRFGKKLGITDSFIAKVAEVVIEKMKDEYPELEKNKKFIIEQLNEEEEKFAKTLEKGLKELDKGTDPFILFTTYGFPIEMTEELAEEKGIKINREEFEKKLTKHQELSRTATAGKFKAGLADDSESVTRLHTATHLLLAALRQVLGNKVFQKGSNITAERLRLDFSYPEKMTTEQLEKVENIVNEQIKKNLPISCCEMSLEDAKKIGAMGVFESKYGEKVKVYSVGPSTNSPQPNAGQAGQEGEKFSCEICGGPHVETTGELGHFKIKKEESSSAGVRRIKALLD